MPERAVVCVDDEHIILLALKSALRRELGPAFRLETATSAESALALIAELEAIGVKTEAVVSDWLMPGMKGDELLRRLRSERPSTCLVLLTGYADRGMVESLRREIGLEGLFSKPCDVRSVASLLLGCLPA